MAEKNIYKSNINTLSINEKKEERKLITYLSLGSMFEWFEIFLFIYWAPLISSHFLDFSIPFAELIYAIVIFGVGLISRPIGGLIFGYIGDRWGRKNAFLISIILITLPSLALAFMPTFTSWIYASLIYIGLMRLLQGVPAGGELPGALCLLAEGAARGRKRYVCSYLFVGPQIGQILSLILCFTLQTYLSQTQLISWGWRLSFFISGIIGVIGFFFRKGLHESPVFEKLKTDHKIEHHPLRESFQHHKKDMAIAFFLSFFEVVGFFMIYFYLFENSNELLKINKSHQLPIYLTFLILLTILMPIFGKIGPKYSTLFLFKLSAFGVIILSYPFYLAIYTESIGWIFTLLILLILFFCIQFSILPSFLANLFPENIRFTCIGFSFNITDGIVGGIIPYIGYWLTKNLDNPGAFVLLFPLTAIFFLIGLTLSKKPHSI